ncbi:MAG: S9 family peptidase [Spirochaetales bacterium]|nr:S9 family peptidase [Spirochaetales bacterium]
MRTVVNRKQSLHILLIFLTSASWSCKRKLEKAVPIQFQYPETKVTADADVYFGVNVPDPYRWLEKDTAAETRDWIGAQNEVTTSFLNQIPFRSKIQERLTKIWNFERISEPRREGKYRYFSRNTGLQNQDVIYRLDDAGKESLFLDPNSFSSDGTTALGGLFFSRDGSRCAYTFQVGGSDWQSVTVLNTETLQPLETLTGLKFTGIAWHGNSSYYYSRYDMPDGSQLSAKTDQHKIYLHQVGQPQSADRVIFGQEQKRRYASAVLTEDERFLVIATAQSTTGNDLLVRDLSLPDSRLVPVVTDFESVNYVLDNDGDRILLLTDRNAPRKRVVSFRMDKPAPEHWVDVIPETDAVLGARTGSGFLFARYEKDALTSLKQYDYSGKHLRDIALPGPGTAWGLSGKRSDKELYYLFTSYTVAETIYSYEPATGKSAVFRKPAVDFDATNFESKQIFYHSKDGTRVPMMLTHRKGLERNGQNPVLLYGYGGFGASLVPAFSVTHAIWLEMGGILAVPNIRGGGEYGKSWHDAGTKQNKQNTFDDFIAAAEYLIKENYTASSLLAIRGASNGGLLVGAVMAQRPDLFAVAIPQVGVLDMLRYHTFTAGAGWAYDYGTAQDNPQMFEYLRKYSPVHNVQHGKSYPATLIVTGDHDDRVVPAHSYKFAATLQAAQPQGNPVLLRVDLNTGHGAGTPTSRMIAEDTDILAFIWHSLGFGSVP